MTTPENWPWPTDVRGLWKDGRPGQRSVLNISLFHEMKQARMAGEIACAQAWRDAAVLDGWSMRPTYQHEPVNRAFTLERDGWVVQGLARPGDDEAPPLPTGSINVWAPDKLHIVAPIVYPGFSALERMMTRCDECKKFDLETVRVGFANRVCRHCLPEVRKAVERPGWCD